MACSYYFIPKQPVLKGRVPTAEQKNLLEKKEICIKLSLYTRLFYVYQ